MNNHKDDLIKSGNAMIADLEIGPHIIYILDRNGVVSLAGLKGLSFKEMIVNIGLSMRQVSEIQNVLRELE